jgi:hypothetical protein
MPVMFNRVQLWTVERKTIKEQSLPGLIVDMRFDLTSSMWDCVLENEDCFAANSFLVVVDRGNTRLPASIRTMHISPDSSF